MLQQDQAVGQEEVASAVQIVLAMVKTIKALRLYLPNNPVLIGFIAELENRMTVHLARYGELSLDVEQFALRCRDALVYENREPRESMASRLYLDGIRTLFFDRGVQSGELVALLGIVGFDRPGTDDDIVTRLWERNLQHIGYLTEDDYRDAANATETGAPGAQREALARIRLDLAGQPPAAPRMIPKHELMLNAQEQQWLRDQLEVEGRCNGVHDVTAILAATVEEVRDPELFGDFVALSGAIVPNLLLAGDVGHALKMVLFLDRLQRYPGTAPERQRIISDALGGVLCDATLESLRVALDGCGSAMLSADVKELLTILGRAALRPVCELLGRVEKLKVRKMLVEVLVDLGRPDPGVFRPFLGDPRWYLVRNVVLILSLIGTPQALEIILGLIAHREPRVRREVLRFLERTGDAKAKTYLIRYLRDDSSALRVKALQVLARERLSFALKPILAMAGAEEFHGRPFTEKKEVYKALGELGQERVIPMLRELLVKRFWFQKTSEKEAVELAVTGLERIRSAAVLPVLEEARDHKRGEVRGILERAVSETLAARGGRRT